MKNSTRLGEDVRPPPFHIQFIWKTGANNTLRHKLHILMRLKTIPWYVKAVHQIHQTRLNPEARWPDCLRHQTQSLSNPTISCLVPHVRQQTHRPYQNTTGNTTATNQGLVAKVKNLNSGVEQNKRMQTRVSYQRNLSQCLRCQRHHCRSMTTRTNSSHPPEDWKCVQLVQSSGLLS